MVVKTLISEEEYLSTPYESPAPDYVLGELVERSMPNLSHSKAQRRIMALIETLAHKAPLFGFPELRLPVGEGKYRIADLVVFAGKEPLEELPRELPLVVIEIVSPDDRLDDILSKLSDYKARGIRHIWPVDPGMKSGFVFEEGGLRSVQAFDLPEFAVQLRLDEILG
jgi:Uma2 family endonuclease